MRIAVLSGKGGTGKTTVAASMAASLPGCQYIDCDVEEPNGALFLKPEIRHAAAVTVPVPVVDEKMCTGCGACAEACRFNAIAVISKKVLVFPEVCHHCGACGITCPTGAITEEQREIGVIEADGEGSFLQGRLNIGEPVSVPVIRELKKRMRTDVPVILDCPPGASCAVVRTIEGCDTCILVTEPTPFGLYDLNIAVQVVRKMDIVFGVVLNKAMDGDTCIQEYCGERGIPVLLEIPFSREIATAYSGGVLPAQMGGAWKGRFLQLYASIERGVGA